MLQTAKIVSAPSPGCWSQIHTDDGLMLVIKIKVKEPQLETIRLPALGRTIIARFDELYQAEAETGVLQRLTQALTKIKEEFNETKPELVVGVVFKNALYLGILNQGRVVLFRNGQLATVLETQEGLVTASGFLKETDIFVLGTERFFETFSQEKVKEALKDKSPGAAAEVLAPTVQEKEEADGLAALIIRPDFVAESQKPAPVKTKTEKIIFWGQALSSVLAKSLTKLRSISLPRIPLDRLKGWPPSFPPRPGLGMIKERDLRFWPRISTGLALTSRRRVFAPTDDKKQKMMMTVGIVLVALLLISILLGWQKKRKAKERAAFDQFWEEIEHQYQEGKSLAEINPLLARDLLQESLSLTQAEMANYSEKSWQYQQLSDHEKEAQEELEKVLREYKPTEVPVFLDLGLIKKDLRGLGLDFWEEKIVLLGQDGTVVTIDMNKKTEILGKVAGGKLVTLWGKNAFVLADKIIVLEEKTEIEKDWGEVIGFESFAGNLYLLDKQENEVWKYPVIEEGFGAKRKWLGPGVEPDFSQAVEMSIDGDLWVLFSNGKILKYTRGSPKGFSVAGLDQDFQQPAAIYTDEDTEKLYILDKGNHRVVAIGKNGEYDSQYVWEGIKDIKDLVVSEKEKKIFLMSDEKIYQLELKS